MWLWCKYRSWSVDYVFESNHHPTKQLVHHFLWSIILCCIQYYHKNMHSLWEWHLYWYLDCRFDHQQHRHFQNNFLLGVWSTNLKHISWFHKLNIWHWVVCHIVPQHRALKLWVFCWFCSFNRFFIRM